MLVHFKKSIKCEYCSGSFDKWGNKNGIILHEKLSVDDHILVKINNIDWNVHVDCIIDNFVIAVSIIRHIWPGWAY